MRTMRLTIAQNGSVIEYVDIVIINDVFIILLLIYIGLIY